MLISEDYREQNAQLHKSREDYGKSSSRWAIQVMQLCAMGKTTDVLDYGCGKGMLNLCLPFGVKQYDPAIPKHAEEPDAADVVACTDVLEHIEPDYLDGVLADLNRCTKGVGLFVVHCGPAKKHLPDGRNAHLIQEKPDWWIDKVKDADFEILQSEASENDIEVMMVVSRKEQ